MDSIETQDNGAVATASLTPITQPAIDSPPTTVTSQSPKAEQPKTFNYKGVDYPLFAFDEPPVVRLPNGTVHHFRMWDEVTEKKKEDFMKTVVLTSAAIINGESPTDSKTDYTRATLWYYQAMIKQIEGVQLNGNDPSVPLDAHATVEIDGGSAKVFELIGVPERRAAAGRIYGGKIELVRPDEDDEVDIDLDDPFDNITETVAASEKPREIYKLSLNRSFEVRQEIGVEVQRNGQTTDPTEVIIYRFREPNGEDFSKWELKAFRGFAVKLNKGGEKGERFVNLEPLKQLFDTLIDNIDGASLNGKPIELSADRSDPQRIAILAQIPIACKKNTIVRLFAELGKMGNF